MLVVGSGHAARLFRNGKGYTNLNTRLFSIADFGDGHQNFLPTAPQAWQGTAPAPLYRLDLGRTDPYVDISSVASSSSRGGNKASGTTESPGLMTACRGRLSNTN